MNRPFAEYRCMVCGYQNDAGYTVNDVDGVYCDALCPNCKDSAVSCSACGFTGLAQCTFVGVPVTLRKFDISWTAEVVTPDGSDMWEGEPCEPGSGATIERGWISPAWSRAEVWENYSDVTHDRWQLSDGPAVGWLNKLLTENLNCPDIEYYNYCEYDSSVTLYSQDAEIVSHYTGVTTTVAAHITGFTESEIMEALA